MDIHQLFGRRLRCLRQQAGWTQEQLARASRFSATSISNIERGEHGPAFHRLPRLASALRVELHELFIFRES